MSNGKWQPSRACWQSLNEEYGNLISPIRPANETAFPRRCEQKANDPHSPAPSLSQEAPPSPFPVDKCAVNFIFSGKQRPVSSSLPPFPGLCPAGIPGLSLPLGAAKASLPTHGAVTGWVTSSAGHPLPARPPAMTPAQGHVQFCQIWSIFHKTICLSHAGTSLLGAGTSTPLQTHHALVSSAHLMMCLLSPSPRKCSLGPEQPGSTSSSCPLAFTVALGF